MTRGRRVAAQVALLPVLWGLSSLSDQAFTIAVGLAVVVVWPLALAVAGVLVWLARSAERDALKPGGKPAPETLLEAADNAVTYALVATGIALAGLAALARAFGIVLVPGRPIVVFLSWALVLHGLPSITWARTLRNVWLPMIARGRRPGV